MAIEKTYRDTKDDLDSKFQMFYYLSINSIENALMSPPTSYDFSSAKLLD